MIEYKQLLLKVTPIKENVYRIQAYTHTFQCVASTDIRSSDIWTWYLAYHWERATIRQKEWIRRRIYLLLKMD